MHDGGVVAPAKAAADLGQRPAGQLLGQIHRHLPRPGDGAQPLRPDQVGKADVVMLGHLALDLLDRQLAVGGAQDVGQAVLGQVQRDLAADQAGKGEQPGQRAFQHADVGGDAMRQEFQHTGRDLQALVLAAVEIDLLLQDALSFFDILKLP